MGFVGTGLLSSCGEATSTRDAEVSTDVTPGSSSPMSPDSSSTLPATTLGDALPSTAVTVTPDANAVVRQCSASDLSPSGEVQADAAMGNLKLVVELRNTSDSACVMPLVPTSLSGVDPTGVVLLSAFIGDTYFGNPSPLDGALAPDSQAVVWIGIGQPANCPDAPRQTWSALQMGLPDGSTIGLAVAVDTSCGAPSVSRFGSP